MVKIPVQVWEEVDEIDLNYYLMYRFDKQRLYKVTTV